MFIQRAGYTGTSLVRMGTSHPHIFLKEAAHESLGKHTIKTIDFMALFGQKAGMDTHATPNEPITVSTFYKFTPIADCDALRQPIKAQMLRNKVKGTIILANEGINATISGKNDDLARLFDYLAHQTEVGDLSDKRSEYAEQPFKRTKVKIKKELISLGAQTHPELCVGTYVDATEWNALISRDDVVTIDTRNDYEYRIGHFAGAVNPDTANFKEMVSYTEQYLDKTKHKAIAMYCTGGIRCEKYSSYLLEQGFEAVYHLKGGILQYFADVAQRDSLWFGSCFVFDERVAVGHDLQKDESIIMCYGCGNPLTAHDREHPRFNRSEHLCGYCDK